MSYCVLLVDDDQRIRHGLANHIEWERLGYTSPVLAANVAQARQAMQENKIDVLITDIRLPDESGLDFCRQVRIQYPEMPIFVLSAFSDFEYAREAIRSGVKHYFTKPTDLQAISDAMEKMREELNQKQRQRERQSALEKRYTRAYRFLLSHLWADLAYGVIPEDEALHAFFEENHIELPYGYFCLLQLQMPGGTIDISQSVLRDTLENAGCIVHHFSCTQESVCFLVNLPDEQTLKAALDGFLRKAPPGIQLSVSTAVSSLGRLSKCAAQLRHIADAPGRLKRFAESNSREVYSGFPENGLGKALLSAVTSGNEIMAIEALDKLYKSYAHVSEYARRDIFVQLLVQLQQYTRRFGVTLVTLYGEEFSASHTAQQLYTPLQMDTWLKKHVHQVLALLKQSQAAYFTQIIESARAYVVQNFANEITLSAVAQEVHLSPHYVSKLFKKVTGEKFIDYLTSVRMEKAMELLYARDSRVYEIAEQVGYKSTKHFSQIFRAYTGKTPLEYKKSVCKNEGITQ